MNISFCLKKLNLVIIFLFVLCFSFTNLVFAASNNKGYIYQLDTKEATKFKKQPVPAAKPAKEKSKTSAEKKPLFSNILLVGLGEGQFGMYDVKSQGSLPSTAYELKEKIFSIGRFAYYFKGILLDKYTITSSLDTKRDIDALFRNPDEDKFYPTYGDDSTVVQETPTQGNFFFKAERDESYLMYGDYSTGLTGTELASYNRTLYGTKIRYESLAQTKFNTPKNEFIGYLAKAKQLAAHDEMASTGGSLYYLRHKRVIEGSEKVYVQVRDKDTFFVKSLMPLTPDTDYEIDYDDGRILLTTALFMTMAASQNTIIQKAVLSGDHIYIIVDYEYEPTGYLDDPSYGVRYAHEFGDNLKMGTTYVTEITGGINYKLQAVDLLMRLNEENSSNFSFEFASSDANTIVNSITYNGGISFSEVTNVATNNTSKGEAFKGKLNLDLKDMLKVESLKTFDLSSYYQDIDPGFSSSASISQEGTVKFGYKLSSELSDKTKASLSYDDQKVRTSSISYVTGAVVNPIAQTSLLSKRSKITTAAIEHQLTTKAKITQEYRHQILDSATTLALEDKTDNFATRLDYELSDDLSTYMQQQYTIDGKDNNITTLGFAKSFKIKTDKKAKDADEQENEEGKTIDEESTVTLTAEQSFGNFGDATRFGISREDPDGSISYMNYSLGTNIEGNRTLISAFGNRLKLSPTTSLYKEEAFQDNYSSFQKSTIMGLDYTPENNPALTLGASYERSYLDDAGGASYKDATALKLTYLEKDKIKLSSKVELRNLKSDVTPTRQFATFNQLEYILNPDLRFFGNANWSTSQDLVSNSYDAHLREYTLGFGYRPVRHDKLNMFGKYSYIIDDASAGQSDPESIAESINHVYAVEGIYQLTNRLSFTGKYALKMRKELATTDISGHIKSTTDLYLGRISYKFFKDFTFHLEDRLLSQYLADTKKNGLLIEITKPVFQNFVVGIGFNFTDFDDKDMSYLAGYTARGPYFRFTTKFFESK